MGLGIFKKKIPGKGGEEYGFELTPNQLKEKMEMKNDFILLDVRENFEYEICKIKGAVEIPLRELAARSGELDKSKEIVAYCHSGARSMEAIMFLKSSGFKKVKHLRGGISSWAEDVEPKMQRY